MLSAFLKKLLFARQLFMTDGRIEVLGKSQFRLPCDVIVAMQSLDEKKYYDLVKNGIKQNMQEYTKKIGANSSGMFKITGDIFETFGLGKPEIIVLDQKTKSATVRFHQAPAILACAGQQYQNCVLLPAALAGMFSFLFNKDVNCDVKKCPAKGGVCEYVVR